MRTNIVLDEALLKEAMRYSHARSRRALVEEALQTYVAVKAAERRAEDYRSRVAALDRRLAGIELRERPHRVLRADRQRS